MGTVGLDRRLNVSLVWCRPSLTRRIIVLGDFWEARLAEENINVKEIWAIVKVLESLPIAIRDCRVDV